MLIRYKGQLYRRVDNANQDFVRYLKTNRDAKKSILPFVKSKKDVDKVHAYLKAMDEAIKELENSKIPEAKRALETAIKHSTNPVDTNALKSVIQKLK